MNLSNPTRRRTFLQSAFAAATAAFIGNKAEAVLTAEPAPAFAVDALYSSTLSSTTLQGEVADRLCIRKLVDAWAHYADRRIADRQAGLFTPDGPTNFPKTRVRPHLKFWEFATTTALCARTARGFSSSVNSSGIGPTNARSLSKTAEGSPRPKNL